MSSTATFLWRHLVSCAALRVGHAQSSKLEKDKVPFDRAAYRAFAIPRDTAAAIAALTGPIENILTCHTKGIPCKAQ